MIFVRERIRMFLRYGYLFNGERVCPDIPVANFHNHLKVYEFAQQFCANKKVLDIGCGTGYGSAKLAEVASEVVGIDLSRIPRAAEEMARVLKTDGLCLLATPNPEAFEGCPPNPHHTHEYSFAELKSLLEPLFEDVLIFENQLSPRKDRGVIGKSATRALGHPLSTEHLSNTHSFFCFLARPH
jgi:SAM-dependent methyltransferase